jgi:DNA-binding transcriptional MocR family regulator
MKWPIYVDSALDDSGLSPMAFRVLGHLSRRANGTGEAFPSVTAITNTCGGRRETIIAAIRELEAKGLIETNRKWGTRNGYRLNSKWGDVLVTQTVPVTQTVLVTQTRVTSYPNGPDQLPAKSANQVPEPLEASEGLPLRSSIKEKARKRAARSLSADSSNNGKMPIPASLQTSAFLKAWADFDNYRRNGKAKRAWTHRAQEIALSACTKLGPVPAVAAIERSIMSGWTGIFPRNETQKPRPQPSNQFPDL